MCGGEAEGEVEHAHGTHGGKDNHPSQRWEHLVIIISLDIDKLKSKSQAPVIPKPVTLLISDKLKSGDACTEWASKDQDYLY